MWPVRKVWTSKNLPQLKIRNRRVDVAVLATSSRHKPAAETADVKTPLNSVTLLRPPSSQRRPHWWAPVPGPLMPRRRVRLMFVDRRYRFPSVSQAELAEAEGDEGLSAYRISAEGFWKDARAGE